MLEHLNASEAIMVDKGFLIMDLLQGTGIEVIRPPCLASDSKFSNEDRQAVREISSSRIVVENVNSRFKKFKILSRRINIKYMAKINEIVCICCCLTNFGCPLRS